LAHDTDPDRLPPFERLLGEVSSRLSGLRGEEMDSAIRDALGDLCGLLQTDRATLFEFSVDGRRFESVEWWASEGIPPTGNLDAARLPWYVGRLLRGETVAVERLPDDLPAGSDAERELVLRSGMKSNLTVPLVVPDHPVCALATGAFRARRAWPDPLIERVRLFGQVLTAAVHRRRQERALEESQAEIERLNRRLRRENRYLQEEIRTERHADEIVGPSPGMQRALAAVDQVAPLASTVLLLGETGTGKELLARAIHDRSPRRSRALVALNCAALPAGLLESELFGHEKGAFTGASSARPGRFEVADGGTLFLDEVGDLPLEAQAKLLRVLQEGTFERLGSTRTRRVDVRLIAATHRDLATEEAAGRFRPDLYYRLSVFPITLPPLRERPEDIEPLVWFFVHRRQKAMGRRIESLPEEALEALRQYSWPGNVRELENVVERALIVSTGPSLALESVVPGRGRVESWTPPSGHDLEAVQRAHIQSVLAACGWKINGPGNAAERLGLHPNTLRFRMKKLGIARPPGAGLSSSTRPRGRPSSPPRSMSQRRDR
jgi:transcriptional regulator with GAF, ATPase, and Fis domain